MLRQDYNTTLNRTGPFIFDGTDSLQLFVSVRMMEPSIKISRHHNRSLPTALLQFLIRPFGSLISKPGKTLPSASLQLKPPALA